MYFFTFFTVMDGAALFFLSCGRPLPCRSLSISVPGQNDYNAHRSREYDFYSLQGWGAGAEPQRKHPRTADA
jgi:hypothetical protein